MGGLTRKQRELASREAALLDVARAQLAEGGYLGMSMDRIAEEMEYSKGTIYQHFSCKEEVLIALAIQTGEKRTSMFRRAADLEGSTRERIHGIGTAAELFVLLYPDHFRVEQTIRSASLWEKTSAQRQTVLRKCEIDCMEVVAGVIRDAMTRGDLDLEEHQTAEEVAFSLWSISYGASTIMSSSRPLSELGIADPNGTVRTAMNHMLDGWGWRPTTAEWDYEASRQRILDEVFPAEAAQAETLRHEAVSMK